MSSIPRIKKNFLVIATAFTFAIILYQLKEYSQQKNLNTKANLNLLKIEGTNPSTAFFDYQLPATTDSMFLQFGDLPPNDAFLNSEENLISHFYSYPGLFSAYIQTKEQVVSDSLQIFIPSNGWKSLAYYFNSDVDSRYFPIPINQAQKDGVFHPTKKILAAAGMDTTQIIALRLDNYKATESIGDSFILKTRLKNVSFWPAVRCYSAYIYIIGDKGEILFKLVNQGCSFHSEYKLSEKSVKGSTVDLSTFSIDMSKWSTIEIENINKNIRFRIDSEDRFMDSYNKSIGNIMGVSLIFHGSGFVDFFEIRDINDKLILGDEF